MALWEYTLTGFSTFFEQRRVAFAKPLQADRVCSTCGRVPSITVVLPCSHVVCTDCRIKVVLGERCPFDRMAFNASEPDRHHFQQSELQDRRVFCTVGGRKCPNFSGRMSDLMEHMLRCRSIDVNCGKCRRPVPSELVVEHYRSCGEEDPRRTVPVERDAEELEDVDSDRQQWTLADACDDDDDVVHEGQGLFGWLASTLLWRWSGRR
ncbi:hypothetical protein HPB52_008686 [Rhipicephalus sanguineus]|uniref:RING-type domain-containing protein n=1 Tax=Rhipicephalus sanguineus TaxID=34632 RepID=A0A9D4QD17_RHISA|nr:hypothetical protein HPB52_008686 [Rhipicephalus sanguineus]